MGRGKAKSLKISDLDRSIPFYALEPEVDRGGACNRVFNFAQKQPFPVSKALVEMDEALHQNGYLSALSTPAQRQARDILVEKGLVEGVMRKGKWIYELTHSSKTSSLSSPTPASIKEYISYLKKEVQEANDPDDKRFQEDRLETFLGHVLFDLGR
jgi:hypothetical protein